MSEGNDIAAAAFDDPESVARYAEAPKRMVPGFEDMQRLAMLLLAEKVPNDGRVLVLGAGGGLELKVFADAHTGWTFDGVDPSAEMLKLAEQTLGSSNLNRVQLHEGEVDIAPEGPFDGATCILTMHFVEIEQRQKMLREIYRRLKPGAPFVATHLSFPQDNGDRAKWLSRYAAFAISSGIEPEEAYQARDAIDSQLTILSPDEDEAMLRDAGFSVVSLFYTGFTFRGWVAYA
tara:strand:+ start:669074 stop:669772 length:699 start_codon:yes stop_codon:yes gene_type:complete